MKHYSRIIFFLIALIGFTFMIYIFIYFISSHQNNQIVGSYKLTISDYSHQIVYSEDQSIFYLGMDISLCLDKKSNYLIFFNSCFNAGEVHANYLSVGKFEYHQNEIILTDQWNQTVTKLLKIGNKLVILKGFRCLMGKFFTKEIENDNGVDENNSCGDDWVFTPPFNKIKKDFNTYVSSNNLKNLIAPLTPPVLFKSTSICGFENIKLEKDGTFQYRLIDSKFYSFIILQGCWKQKGKYLVLTDPIVNNSYYMELAHDTLEAGFNLPGSSEIGGKNPYLQAFVLK